MVANCRSCPHWWLCTKDRNECELFSMPEPVYCTKDEMLMMTLTDLRTLMLAGNGNYDICELCIGEECFGRGGKELCAPRYRGRLINADR